MRLLLDTHALIWAVADPARLSETARVAVADGENDVLVSTASAWEVAIMRMLGRLDFADVTPELPIVTRDQRIAAYEVPTVW